ncbi:HAD family hydrolase [Streptomyces violascens]|uniref:HAD family hydrolase n=1 Tax=Streptomyces violascens TaxID=67381 RepID=UPI0037AFCEA5
MSVTGSKSPVTQLVFADVDETLIRPKSVLDFLEFYFAGRYGAEGARHARQTLDELAAMMEAGATRNDGNRFYYRAWRGQPAADVNAWGARWFAERRAGGDFYVPATRAALRRHVAEGAAVVLVSGSFSALLDPIAVDIGARHVRGTRPEIRDGLHTGAVIGTSVIGEGKRAVVRGLLRDYPHIRAADCYGYGDHVSDLPMLTEVGHPVVVGNNLRLLSAVPGAVMLRR